MCVLVHLLLVPCLNVLLHWAGQFKKVNNLGDLVNEDKVRLQGSNISKRVEEEEEEEKKKSI